jgi:hypothetical protein
MLALAPPAGLRLERGAQAAPLPQMNEPFFIFVDEIRSFGFSLEATNVLASSHVASRPINARPDTRLSASLAACRLLCFRSVQMTLLGHVASLGCRIKGQSLMAEQGSRLLRGGPSKEPIASAASNKSGPK